MSEMSKTARAEMRAKANRMAGGDPHKKVDASTWSPTEPLNTTQKTGARPIRPRIYKAGGKVQGDRGPRRADKLPRENANAKVNRNVPAANAEEFGRPHIGGFKKGGEARRKRDMGGMTDPRATANEAMAAAGQRSGTSPNRMDFGNAKSGVSKMVGLKKGGRAKRADGGGISEERKATILKQLRNKEPPDLESYRTVAKRIDDRDRKLTGREPRKSGGRTKGKTNINIVIGQPQAQPQPPQNMAPVKPPMPPPQPPPQMPPPPPGGMPGGPGGPPMPPPSMAGGSGMPMPMPRKRGGRTTMDAGAGSGEGRLEKIQLQKRTR